VCSFMATARISSTNAFPSSPLAAGAISVAAAASLLDVTAARDTPVTGRAGATATDTLFHLPDLVLGGARREGARAEESDAGAMVCGVGPAAEAERLERERDEEDGVGIE
jgi:hypothetical protein